MSAEGMGPSVAVEGATTATVFETYIERVVGPTLRRPGRLVVMDNLGAHEGERVKELIEGKGCELLCLPSYSPDLDPIEEAFSPNQGRPAQARSARKGGSGGSAGCGPLDAVTALGTPWACWSTVATVGASNLYENCCMTQAASSHSTN
jgi:DDE superfamily endonuclease